MSEFVREIYENGACASLRPRLCLGLRFTMPKHSCPACGVETPRVIEAPTLFSLVNYYRCEHCGHVWTTDKNDHTKLIHHVTPLRERKSLNDN